MAASENADEPVEPGQRDQDEDDIIEGVPDPLEQSVQDIHVSDEIAPGERLALRGTLRREARIVEGWVFPGRRKGRPLNTDAFHKCRKKAADLAQLDLPPGCGFHAFRRKLATELATEQLAVIQALGGWSQPQVVVARYQKVPVEVQREVLAKRRIG